VILLALIVAAVIPFHIEEWWNRQHRQRESAIAVTGGNPDAAPMLFKQYGCTGCHTIPGIEDPTGTAGPPLQGLAQRTYIGGVITNTPANLEAFIVDPQSIDPKSAMPKTGITPEQARDVAAYLYANGK
jgi:cytochrome c2